MFGDVNVTLDAATKVSLPVLSNLILCFSAGTGSMENLKGRL